MESLKISARQLQALTALWIFSSALTGAAFAADVADVTGMILGAVGFVAVCGLICFAEGRMSCGIRGAVTALSGISMVFYAGIMLRILCGAVAAYLLPDTPEWMVAAVFSAAACYMALLGLDITARTGEILFIAVAFNAVIAALLWLAQRRGADINNGVLMAKGLRRFCMLGAPQVLFVLLPHTEDGKKREKAVTAAAISVAAAVMFNIMALYKFGAADFAARAFPVLDITGAAALGSLFGDRQDVLMLRTWTLAAFPAIGLGVSGFAAARGKGAALTAVGCAAAFIISVAIDDMLTAIRLLYTAGEVSFVLFGVVVPVAALLVQKVGVHNDN